jgi:hypothetical protein
MNSLGSRIFRHGVIAALGAIAACATPAEKASSTTGEALQAAPFAPVSSVPGPGGAPSADRIRPMSMPSLGANRLSYHGGPIISNIKVVKVDWNGNVDPTTSANMTAFYSAFVTSEQWAGLNQYNTVRNANSGPNNGQPGTQQNLGLGTAQSASGTLNQTATNVTDAQIQTAIAGQLGTTLPTPDSNTLYAIHFPPNSIISAFGWTSCQGNGGPNHAWFGAYHNAFTTTVNGQSQRVRYAVIDDSTVDCGGAYPFQAALDNQTHVASHELMEAATDPDLNAWFDDNTSPGEAGDLCNGQPGFIDARKPDGTHWAVQLIYNQDGFCAVDPLLTLVSSASAGVKPSVQPPLQLMVGATGGTIIDIRSMFYDTDDATGVRLGAGPVPVSVFASMLPAATQPSSDSELSISTPTNAVPGSFVVEVWGSAYGGKAHAVPVAVDLVPCVPVTCDATACGHQPDGCGGNIQCTGGCDGGTCVPETRPQACSQSCGGEVSDGCGGTYVCPSTSPRICCQAHEGSWKLTPPPAHCEFI